MTSTPALNSIGTRIPSAPESNRDSWQPSATDVPLGAAMSALADVLAQTRLASIATVDDDGNPHLSSSFFACLDDHTLVFLTSSTSRHVMNARSRDCAVSITDTTQSWGGPLRGVTLTGVLRAATGRELVTASIAYARRFLGQGPLPSTEHLFSSRHGRVFIVRATRIEVIDSTRIHGKAVLERCPDQPTGHRSTTI